MDDKKLYEEWLTSPVFDEATKAELKAIAGNDAEIGTGSIRILNLEQVDSEV